MGTEKSETGLKKFHGVVVVESVGSVHIVQWVVGGTSFHGIGVLKGDTLSIGWSHNKMTGVTIMTRNGNDWTGQWTSLPGNGVMNGEIWQFLSKLDQGKE